jgi:MerR family transcriptional regulator, light-induced transcriptional regulator
MDMSAFTIKDLENISGIKAHTIRMWEQRYNFLKPQRSCTNIRYYSNEELKTLLNIALLNKYGVKISHIDRMQPDEICQKILALRDAEAIQEKIINDLVQEMVDLETDKFEAIINEFIAAYGIERGVREIIFPFLEKIGILWQTGHIMPAQEHFVTNIIRQKLIVAIDSCCCERNGKTCILFLPEGEYHELGLLFLSYVVKCRGFRVIYLGSNVPLSDVESIVNTMRPEIAFVHLTSTSSNFNFERMMKNINQRIGGIQTVISGFPTRHYHKEPPANVSLKRSFTEVLEFISSYS